MNYGKAFKDIREAAGITRPDLAKAIGVTPSALSKIEAGKTIPKQKTIKSLCTVACVPLAYFYQRALTIKDYVWPSPAQIIVEPGEPLTC